MTTFTKNRSPFYPSQPVPVELFVGRKQQIDEIRMRGLGQVAAGKPVAVFVEGEYGIGKSSIANYIRMLGEQDYGLHGIYATLETTRTTDDMGAAILRATHESGVFNPRGGDKVRDFIAKYIGEQTLPGLGLTLRMDALKREGPNVANGLLPFLRDVVKRLEEYGVQGIVLVLDEINGIASQPDFARFIKSLVDRNAVERPSLPLLLVFCGVEDRRHEMIRNHPSIGRVFDIVASITPMSSGEMSDFYLRAFESVSADTHSGC